MREIIANKKTKYLFVWIGLFTICTSVLCTQRAEGAKRYSFGVFIGADEFNYSKMGRYDKVVIDAENCSKKEVSKLKKAGCKKVYSYLNIGSLETYRSYYSKYQSLTLKPYENWEDEYWIDVTNKSWQNFCVKRAKKLAKKGIDGFFIDNCDVYYQYPKNDVFDGLYTILSELKQMDTSIIINGADPFVSRCIKEKKCDCFDGVNQESVYTAIDFSTKTILKAAKEERNYFTAYLNQVKKAGKEVYVLEYAKSAKLQKQAQKYAQKHNWNYYISNNLYLGTVLLYRGVSLCIEECPLSRGVSLCIRI